MKRRAARRGAIALLLAAGLAACSPAPGESRAAGASTATVFGGKDVNGARFGRDFRLTDGDGRQRSLADFRGKVVLLFFGFTQCPDVCPTELTRIADLRRRLGAEADKVQGVFVTLDPDRDTAPLVRDYVRAFDPGFVGLRGDAAATAATAKEFKVFHQKVEGSAPDRYTLNHSASLYAFDPSGRLRLIFQPSTTPEQMLADVRLLIAGH